MYLDWELQPRIRFYTSLCAYVLCYAPVVRALSLRYWMLGVRREALSAKTKSERKSLRGIRFPAWWLALKAISDATSVATLRLLIIYACAGV